jgi:N-methylhydantoinase A
MAGRRYRLGVDIGGTFTDIVLLGDQGDMYSKKVLSTPRDYSEAISEGCAALLTELAIDPADIGEFVHATTVATNTLIERKGARVALVTTAGFRDVLELGRFRAPRLYDPHFRKPDPLAGRALRFEVKERIAADGAIVTPLDEAAIPLIAAALRKAGVEAVAVTLVNSYANPAHEQRLAAALAELLPGVSVTASVELLPQIGEYERSSTTTVNAYIRPVVERYMRALSHRLAALRIGAPLMIMQSSGGITPGAVAAARPIDIIESGPAAGVLGGQRLGRRIGVGDMIVFDMGGTTAKATIIEDHAFTLCPEAEVGGGIAQGQRMIRGGGYPVQVPTIDIAEVGAGGGSIAAVDAAGGLRVGPVSAGAEPGPVCYGRGGTEPTVTDANLLLGYLNPAALVSGELALDRPAAEAAVNRLAARLGLEITETAYGIHLIANATMLRALRGVSSERGRDPAHYAMLAIGGNGAVHACTLAEAAGITQVIVPPVAGLFSALGMLFADVEHQLVNAFYHRMAAVDAEGFNAALQPLLDRGSEMLAAEGYPAAAQRSLSVFADMKYVGQTAPLSLPVAGWPLTPQDLAALADAFHAEHQHVFGYASVAEPIQFTALRLVCRGIPDAPRMPERVFRSGQKPIQAGTRRAWFGEAGWLDTPVLPRGDLAAAPVGGPLIVEEYDATIVVRPGWDARLDDWNNIVLSRRAG